jgi:hypothetical protein
MPPAGCEPIIPASELTQILALDRAVTGVSRWDITLQLVIYAQVFWEKHNAVVSQINYDNIIQSVTIKSATYGTAEWV